MTKAAIHLHSFLSISIILLSSQNFFGGILAQEFEDCVDSPLHLNVKTNPNNNNKNVFRTCASWANPWRCKNIPGLAESCPLTCDACEIRYGLSECKDSPFRFKYPKMNGEFSGRTRSCAWVGENRKKRCRRPGVTETCRETCLSCVRQQCKAAFPEIQEFQLGNGRCENEPTFDYNTPECGYDGGDCDEFNSKYPDCRYRWTHEIGNGICLNNEVTNAPGCLFDGGDCDSFNLLYPNCTYEFAHIIGDGECTPSTFVNIPECGYDGGDCDEFNIKYPNCTMKGPASLYLGNGRCEGRYNYEECGYEDGDCVEFNTLYPDCLVGLPYLIGDGICHSHYPGYFTEECGYDGGDCD